MALDNNPPDLYSASRDRSAGAALSWSAMAPVIGNTVEITIDAEAVLDQP